MRLSICQGESLPLCASCARNVEHHPPVKGPDYRNWIQPITRGERCLDWYALPPKPPAPPTGA